jgi:hypothetical protein
VPTSALTPLPLSLSRGPVLSALFPSRTPTPSLSVPPSPPVSSFSTSHPQSPRRGRAQVRAFSGHVRAPAPLLSPAPARPPPLSHLRPLPSSLALSLALPTRTGSYATVRRRPPPVPWPPLRSCPVQCHGELHLTISCSGHPSVCPLPPCCVRSALTGAFSCAAGVRHRRPVKPLCLRRCFATPALLLEVSNLPVPLIWLSPLCSSHDCSSEQSSAAVSPPRRGLRSLVPLRRCEGHGQVRQTAQIASRLVPKTREPSRGRPARLRRTLATGPSGATAPKLALVV